MGEANMEDLYKCDDCFWVGEKGELGSKEVSSFSETGFRGQPFNYMVCPQCGSERIDEVGTDSVDPAVVNYLYEHGEIEDEEYSERREASLSDKRIEEVVAKVVGEILGGG